MPRRVALCCVLKRTRRYDDITNVDKLTGVQTQVNQVKEVMQQNVDQMLQTHEKLEDLETKAGPRTAHRDRRCHTMHLHAALTRRPRGPRSVQSREPHGAAPAPGGAKAAVCRAPGLAPAGSGRMCCPAKG